MPNYSETNASGTVTEWQRANRVEVQAEHGQPVICCFYEEKIDILPSGQVIHTPIGTLATSTTDLSTTFNILDPTTGAVLGAMSYAELYNAFASLYFALAAARDAGAGA